jgi:hypothetical protein
MRGSARFLSLQSPKSFTWATLFLGFAGFGFRAYRRNNQLALNAA